MKKKKLLSVLLAALFAVGVFAGCKIENIPLTDSYVLESALMEGTDVTADFTAYNMEFKDDGTVGVFIVYLNIPSRRSSSYVFDGETVRESYGEKEYIYTMSGGKLITEFDDGSDKITVTLKKYAEETTDDSVDFESVLFGEDVNDTKKFNYCPAVLTEKDADGSDVMHIWYCTNKDSGIIMDHIGYRTGVKQENGKWKFSEEEIVLAPTPNTWDSRHTCDPAVIKGDFTLKGEKYNYLMSYLGCTTEDYQKNETGLAVAKDVGGPWVKVDSVNPIIPWYDDGDPVTEQGKYDAWAGTSRIYWGTGMPALLSVDGKSEVILFYQSTLRGTGIRRMDLSDVENPVEKWTVSLSSSGIVNSQGSNCGIGIPDFAYDETTGRLYVVAVTNEKNPADVTLTRVNSHSMLAYIDGLENMEEVSSVLQSGVYRWNMVGYVGPDDTGWERNHNPGLVRDALGYIPVSSQVGVVVSTGHNSWPNENIFTYRLHGHLFDIAP